MSYSVYELPILGQIRVNWGGPAGLPPEAPTQQPHEVPVEAEVHHDPIEQEASAQIEHPPEVLQQQSALLPDASQSSPPSMPLEPRSDDSREVSDKKEDERCANPLEEGGDKEVLGVKDQSLQIPSDAQMGKGIEQREDLCRTSLPDAEKIANTVVKEDQVGGASSAACASLEEPKEVRAEGETLHGDLLKEHLTGDAVLSNPNIRSQIQQPEAMKISLSSPVVSEESLARQPTPILEPEPPRQPIPSSAVHREVPAIQEVIRAKIEESVSVSAELSIKFETLLSVVAPSIVERQSAQIQNDFKTLLGVLIPSLSSEEQAAFCTQLATLHQDVRSILEGKEWEEACQAASAALLSGLHHLSESAHAHILTALGTPSSQHEGGKSSQSPTLADNDEPIVICLPAGWRKHHHKKGAGRLK